MIEETIHRRGMTAVRRLLLSPGETTRWHRDPFHRVSVIFKGDALAIEFRDGLQSISTFDRQPRLALRSGDGWVHDWWACPLAAPC